MGAALLALLTLGAGSVFFVDRIQRELSEGPRIVVGAPSARGLEVGGDVWVAGVPAGRVDAIRLRWPHRRGGPVLIEAVLGRSAAATLRGDASASLRASALLAPTVLSLDPGRAADRPFPFGDTLIARQEETAEEIMARADSLRVRLRELAPHGREVVRRLEDGPGSLASFRRHPAELRRLSTELRRTRRLALASPGGSAMRLLRDTALRAKARRVRSRLADMTAPDGALARSARERASLLAVVDSLRARSRLIQARLDAARGTAGRVLHDRAIQRERRLFRARMDSVRAELLADPLRWIRFRIF
jgi:hypothetical protein